MENILQQHNEKHLKNSSKNEFIPFNAKMVVPIPHPHV